MNKYYWVKSLLISLLCTLCLSSCTDDEDESESDHITLINETKEYYKTYADAQLSAIQLEFATTAAWEMTIVDCDSTYTPHGETPQGYWPSWVTATEKQGSSAGNHNVTLSLNLNKLHCNRYAMIQLKSGRQKVTIRMEQDKYKADGSLPAEDELDFSYTTDGKTPYLHCIDTVTFQAVQKNPEAPLLYLNTNIKDISVISYAKEKFTIGTSDIRLTASPETGEDSYYISIFVNDNPSIKERFADIFLLHPEHHNDTTKALKKIVVRQKATACETQKVDADLHKLTFHLQAAPEVYTVYYWLSEFPNEQDPELMEKEIYTLKPEDNHRFSLTFDNLKGDVSYYLHHISYSSEWFNGPQIIEEGATNSFESEDDIVVTVNPCPANGFKVQLPIGNSSLNNGMIDWGDGQTTEIKYSYEHAPSTYYNHQYNVTESTLFNVRISGNVNAFAYEYGADPIGVATSLVEVKQWGHTGLHKVILNGAKSLKKIASDTRGSFEQVYSFGTEGKMAGAFSDTGLESLPDGLFAHSPATSFDNTFMNCSDLKEIPGQLFANNTQATSFYGTFSFCSSITAIPHELFHNNPQSVSFNQTFQGCKITSIPEDLFSNTPLAEDFTGTFRACDQLISIPEKLFWNCPNALFFGCNAARDYHTPDIGCFERCEKLSGIPEQLFTHCPKAEDFTAVFDGCYVIQEVPGLLFARNPEIKYLYKTFSSCDIRQAPSILLDHNKKVIDASGMFEYNDAMAGESIYSILNGEKVHLYEREKYPQEFAPLLGLGCYHDCKNLSDYNNIPESFK